MSAAPSPATFCGECGTAAPDAMKFCGKCGAALVAPAAEQEPSFPGRHQPKVTPAVGIGLLVILLLGWIVWTDDDAPKRTITSTPPRASSNTPVPDAADITDVRFEAVRDVFAQQSARAERDLSARNTVRIYIPMRVAIQMTKVQAQQMASMARSRLGKNAIVYVKNEVGDTMGKATPWGLQ